jgi:hypothetical protein
MIQLEITQAIVLYTGLLAVLALAIWIYTAATTWRVQRGLGKQFLWRCTFCGISYLDESGEDLSQCPRCGSFNSVEDTNAREVPARPVRPDKREIHTAPAGKQRNPSRRNRPTQRRRGPRKR